MMSVRTGKGGVHVSKERGEYQEGGMQKERGAYKIIQIGQLHISHQVKSYSSVKVPWYSSYTPAMWVFSIRTIKEAGSKYHKSKAQTQLK